MSSIPIYQQLKQARSNMTKSELKIVDLLLQNPAFVIRSSARDFSKLANVSDASVIRFCQKYGFTGYSEMKELLNQELIVSSAAVIPPLSADIYIEDSLLETIDKISEIVTVSVNDTKSKLSVDDLELAIKLIDNAQRLFFVGVGGSGLTALEAQYKFSRIGLDATGFFENHSMAYKIQYTNDRDILVAISHSGEKHEIIETVKTAKSNSTFCIAITNNRNSELASLCDLTLDNCSQGELYQGDSIGTRVSQMFIVDILYTEMLKKRFPNVKSSKIMIKNKISKS
ncbi:MULTISPECIES: MurR/RpiR family transcriptional regulator [unclassified Vibrio]|uniref:MurR/RpiR family transcriptional regulator n=1 Tax=unclassified Vibrio TaxID=2614977 RepID=UPI00354F8B78